MGIHQVKHYFIQQLKNYTIKSLSFFRQYPLPLIWFLAVSSIQSFLQDLIPLFVISSVGLLLILALSKVKISAIQKHDNFIQDCAVFILNGLLIGFLVFQIDKERPENLAIQILCAFYGQCLFLNIFCCLTTKRISIIFFTLMILIKFDIKNYNIAIFFSSIFLVMITLSSKKSSFHVKENKISGIKNSYSSTDLLFEIKRDLRIKSINFPFQFFLKEKRMKKKKFVNLLLKSAIEVKNEYSFKPENKEIMSDISKSIGKENEKEILEDYLKFVIENQEKEFFSVSEIELPYGEKEFIFIWKENEKQFFAIKTEFFFKESLRLKLLSQNYSKAIYYTAHELRNPLNCIINLDAVESLKISELEIFKKDLLKPAVISSKIMLNLVNGLLDIAQIEADTFKLVLTQFDLKSLMKESLKIISFQAKNRGLTLNLNFDPKIGKIKSDSNRLSQIIINFLSNAIKYTMKGSITLSADLIESSQIKITVSDTGLGIDQSNITKLFQAFSKIQNKEDCCLNAQGVGLGLLISNKLAFLLNRSQTGIEVISHLNKGSEFSFKFYDEDSSINDDEVMLSSHQTNNVDTNLCKLITGKEKMHMPSNGKLHESTSSHITSYENKIFECLNGEQKDECIIKFVEEKSEEMKYSHEISISSESINSSKIRNTELLTTKMERIQNKMKKKKCLCPLALIIDDDDFNILSMAGRLKKLNVPYDSALSGEIGVQKIVKMFKNDCCKFFKFIFLDLEMPQKNGLAIYEEISKFYKESKIYDSKVILVTGYSYSSDIVKHAISKGIKNILIKPITSDHIVDIILEIFK